MYFPRKPRCCYQNKEKLLGRKKQICSNLLISGVFIQMKADVSWRTHSDRSWTIWFQAAWIQRAGSLVGEPVGNAGASSCFCAIHRLRTLIPPRRKKPGDDYARISHQPRVLGVWYLITKIYVTTHSTRATILYMSIRSNWSFLLFTFSISLLVFCPAVLIDLCKSQFLICKMMRPVPTSQVDVSVKNATPHKVLIRLTWSNCSLMSATTINPQESM